ncbi:hypothetical protein [Denitromonas sp.]|uniref:hypothetical protein n=1 Tax=Denitromonas sp. TaxID=2734609 RepID=UPI002B0021A7|nr:hypothetical protein [Denitromonas sp.]
MIENPCDLSDADLREWAYDEEIELMEQDEDLLLHDIKYMPVLLECIRDARSPKSDYIFNIVAYFGQLRLLHKVTDEAAALSEEISRQLLLSGGERLAELQHLVFAHRQLVSPRALSTQEADELAYDLLVRHTARSLTITGNTVDGYREYTYAAPYQNYLYVMPELGTWAYSKMRPLRHVP